MSKKLVKRNQRILRDYENKVGLTQENMGFNEGVTKQRISRIIKDTRKDNANTPFKPAVSYRSPLRSLLNVFHRLGVKIKSSTSSFHPPFFKGE